MTSLFGNLRAFSGIYRAILKSYVSSNKLYMSLFRIQIPLFGMKRASARALFTIYRALFNSGVHGVEWVYVSLQNINGCF